jgi:hypothetical protein
MSTYTTADGRVLDEATILRLAKQAEDGFPGVTFTKPRVRTVRLPQILDQAVETKAKDEGTTPSRVIRDALAAYLIPA